MKRAQHWFMSKAICFNNCPPFAPHLVINTALLLSTFCTINRSEAPSSLFISFQIIHSIFDFWSFPRKIFAIFGEEMFNFMKSWKVSFFLWRLWWWCSKTVSSRLLLMRLALPCISGCILRRCQHRIIFSSNWQRCPDHPRVIMWGLSLYCCVSHRCNTAEQRLLHWQPPPPLLCLYYEHL